MNAGVVAIGRNEGERLRACLTSARRDCEAVVYVDSGSTDGSVELARSLGAEVISLDLSKPFTAARARNEGFDRLLQLHPDIECVQFVDGDCELVAAGWIATAVAALAREPKAAVVCGRRRERFPDRSIFNRLCDMEWNTAVGQVAACGGDAMIRAVAFREVSGYNPDVIAGEEPEMCVRLRAKSWTIQRIDAEMTLHDAAMTRFSQWWMRNVRSGHAYAQGNSMHGMPPECFRHKEVRSIRFWTLYPLALVVMLLLILAAVWPRWWWLGLTPLLLYPALAAKVARSRIRKGDSAYNAVLYGVWLVAGKFPQLVGLKKFRHALHSGRRNAIIEYKTPESRPNKLALQAGHDAA